MQYLKVTRVEDVVMYRRGKTFTGVLHLTTHHIIFTVNGGGELWFCYPMIERVDFNRGSSLLYKDGKGGAGGVENGFSASELTNTLSIGLSNLMNGERKDETTTGEEIRGCCIRIQFKDFNYVSFDFKNILKGDDVFESMMKLTCIENLEKLYAFIYQPVQIENNLNSWGIYSIEKEFKRQALDSGKFRISELNKGYKLCDSYPNKLVVPSSISDTILGHTVKYRSKNRFPTLTYYYERNQSCIIRSSQPLVGIKQNRSIQDEKLIHEYFSVNGSNKNLIVDARPLTNAMAQVALGAGTEIMENYGHNSKKVFLNIENIHVMRDSLNKIKTIIKNSDVDGICELSLETFNKTGWLEHISKLLKGTELLVKHLTYEGSNLLVHCSDGWDRTSQVCSLVEVCIDSYYRTIEGLIVLIEKEWISFGHRFNERCGHLQKEDNKFYNHTNEENNFHKKIKSINQRYKHQQNIKFESPIFQQFLDCLYQLMLQYPTKFEFNERFLRRLLYHLYSNQYGTFLQDSERERKEIGLENKTHSVWDYFLSRKAEFTNPAYELDKDVIDVSYSKVAPWKELFGFVLVE